MTTALPVRSQSEPFSIKLATKASLTPEYKQQLGIAGLASPLQAKPEPDVTILTSVQSVDVREITTQCVNYIEPEHSDNKLSAIQDKVTTVSRDSEVSLPETDLALIEGLAGLSDSGIFEVLLPHGQYVGVALERRGNHSSFLLRPSNAILGDRLQTNVMELETALQQRIGGKVRLTVLPTTSST